MIYLGRNPLLFFVFPGTIGIQHMRWRAIFMDREPTLVIMAAGMGSRFGGLKQMTPVDPEGHFIIDFSLCDAHRAGFRKVVFIIKREYAQVFRETIGRRMEPHFDVRYVYQELTNIPEGLAVPEGRVKPWGTGHAVMCCRDVIDGPFAVLNSDDFYGPEAFSAMYQFLKSNDDPACYAMVGYHLRNTVTEFGSVARGICDVQDGMLRDVVERTKIFKRGEDAAYTEDGETFYPLSGESVVSMNFWGFTRQMMDALWAQFPAFYAKEVPQNPEKCEFYLPVSVNAQLQAGQAKVRVLPCSEVWYGVTYHEDLASVQSAIARMKAGGRYPASLWDE